MNDQPNIVVFDVGRVIVQWDMRLLFAKLIDDREQLDWFLANVVTEVWHMQHDAGRPIVEMIEERSAQFPEYSDLIEAYGARFLETIPARVPGTAELIERLHLRGVPLFAITNFGTDFWSQYRPTEPVFDLFRDIVVSGHEEMVKPHRAIFDLAERRFEAPASAMLFVDDNAANIAAADALGWHTHHFEDARRLEAELVSLGLL
ncbi:HAD-IA family hydrolase [Pontixanthobacter gangjinensis]|uniref:HAD-IA family hydrolase n=1 Tax=Pontixanthobacter gangjinensis TaxID=1028742 RepID=A0A6I4SK64_9SPHN|nr:HAD-IA family hydrolase [Pontixanthobacter gangjinensis]MXO56034.1 HAD-IA family hydrolase [Pontixanthobacter gangjinensis]